MNEAKALVESFKSEMKKVVEVLSGRMDKMNESLSGRMDRLESKLEKRFDRMDTRLDNVETDLRTVREQVGFLMEGQTAIREEICSRVTVQEFSRLEKRVFRLEKKTA